MLSQQEKQKIFLLQPRQLQGQYFVGDGRKVMRQFAAGSVRTIIGSSPYYDARDYGGEEMAEAFGGDPLCEHDFVVTPYKMHNGRGDSQKSAKYSEQADVKDRQLTFKRCSKCEMWIGQLGHERRPADFISHLCDYYDEAMRVLHDTGVLFCVIGDTMEKGTKSWLGIPGMFMQEMKNRGWVCRAQMPWIKPNVKPENVNDRPAVNYEMIFMFVKKAKTRFWVNKKLKLVAFRKRRDDIEGEDWFWKQMFLDVEEEGEEAPQPKKNWVHGPTIGRELGTWWTKKSYWISYDYYYEQQYEPYADSTIIEALSKYLGKAVKDYERAGAEDSSNLKRRTNQSTLQSLIDLGALDNLDMEKLGLKMPPAGGVKKADGQNATYSGNRPDFKWGRIMRSTIEMQTARWKDAHFASFPLGLVEIMINMACPPAVCRFCGLPRVRLTSEVRINTRPGENVNKQKSGSDADPNKNFHRSIITKYRQAILRAKHDEFAECECRIEAVKEGDHVNLIGMTEAKPGRENTFEDMTSDEVYALLAREGKWAKPIVLDNWGGTGATCVAADRMGRGWCYIDKNASYVAMAQKRMREDPWKPGSDNNVDSAIAETKPDNSKLDEFGIVAP